MRLLRSCWQDPKILASGIFGNYQIKCRKVGRNKRRKKNPTTFLSSIEMPMQLIMFDGDSRTMLLHHALGINDVRRTELQNGIKFFLEKHSEKISLPFSIIDRWILHPLIEIYLYILFCKFAS